MKSIDKVIVLNLILFITFSILCLNCGDQIDHTGTSDTTSVSPIHFLEYDLDSVNKKWGYDSASNIYSAPTRSVFDFACGIKVRVDIMAYDTMKIQEKEGYYFIDSIKPDTLGLGDNYNDIFTGTSYGNTGLEVFGSNLALRGLLDYYGKSIASIDMKIYDVLNHDTLKYYVGVKSSYFDPDPDMIKNEMNRLTHQAVVHISSVDTIIWDCSPNCPFDLIRGNDCLDYINTDSGFVFNTEYNWIRSNTDIGFSCIVHVKDILFGWRVLYPVNQGDTILTIDSTSLEFLYLTLNEQMVLTDGSNYEYVWVKEAGLMTDDAYCILTGSVQNYFNENSYIIETFSHHPGIAFAIGNLAIVRNQPIDKFIQTACHEFIHQNKNGALGHTEHPDEDRNLMYKYKEAFAQKILKYKTLDGIYQWDQAHP